jgi:thiosulfate/3-mercaptopyruvate sulfurtransferase
MTYANPDALVTTDWLKAHLGDPAIKILDASYFVPGGTAPAKTQYNDGHIPGALFFDIDEVADTSKPKEHTFPTAEIFAAKVGAMGIGNNHHVVVYDHLGGACAAARVWFMFHAFGHNRVSVLDGGRTKWGAESRPISKDTPKFEEQTFQARAPARRLHPKEDIRANIAAPAFQVLDARSKGRFEGSDPEPRAEQRSGHIPGSLNLPFLTLFDGESKTWKAGDVISNAFASAGVDFKKPLVTSCGSGVTACALALGAYLVGHKDTAIYDGSWVEWGTDDNLPIETGPVSGG